MSVAPFVTSPSNASVEGHGWQLLPSGVSLTRMPLVDLSTPEPLFARLTYRGAIEAARQLGGRLPTRDEVIAGIAVARARGRVLRAVTLSFGPEMVGREHAETHDAAVRALLAEWDGQPLAGIGKHWVAGAAPGRSRICGWPHGPRDELTQAGTSDVHDDGHHDYGTTTLLARDP